MAGRWSGRTLTAGLALVGALALAGCSEDPPAPSSVPQAHVKTKPFPASPPGFGATRQPNRIPYQGEPFLLYGYYFGFIRSIGGPEGPDEISFDVAEFLVGDDAALAREINGESPKGPDYHIRNHTHHERTVQVAPDATVSRITCSNPKSCRTTPIAWAELPLYSTPETPFWITLANGVAVDIQEQYLP